MKDYLTIKSNQTAELVIKRSRFISAALKVESAAEAENEIQNIKKLYYDAKHNCYAYIIGADNKTEKYSDDGEPQGTAGIPILENISRRGLTNTLVVVTRYFGGILLGAGGLKRAYSQAASLVLDKAGLQTVSWAESLTVTCTYQHWAKLSKELEKLGVNVETVQYGETIKANLAVKSGFIKNAEQIINDITLGKAQIVFNKPKYVIF